ncbi:MAG TPA: hypothetical protein VF484_01735 [Candidatus Limnocylindrales bacterium]
MNPGGFIEAIGRGVAGLVGGAIGAIGDGIGTMVATGERLLPGPLFPIVVISVVGLFVYWLLRK